MIEGAKFEPGQEFRHKLEEISSAAQRLLLYLLAIIQHRPDLRPEAVPERLRMANSRFRALLGDELQILSARLLGQDYRPDQDVPGALVELQQAVAAQSGTIVLADVAAQIRARLALYQEAVPIVLQMARPGWWD